jgi:hypothetical protein
VAMVLALLAEDLAALWMLAMELDVDGELRWRWLWVEEGSFDDCIVV